MIMQLTAPNMGIYRRLMTCPTYSQDLDLVIIDDANTVVGFANIWHDSENNIAIIEPFGTASLIEEGIGDKPLIRVYAPLESTRRQQALH